MERKSLSGWKTEDEIEFLRGLGKHRAETYRPGGMTRREYLQRYLQTMDLRDWEELDRLTVEFACRRFLEEEGRKGK
jgi:hypothetical protein